MVHSPPRLHRCGLWGIVLLPAPDPVAVAAGFAHRRHHRGLAAAIGYGIGVLISALMRRLVLRRRTRWPPSRRARDMPNAAVITLSGGVCALAPMLGDLGANEAGAIAALAVQWFSGAES